MMKARFRHTNQKATGNVLSVLLMAGCLLFMTMVNFFLYPSPNQDTIVNAVTQGNSGEDFPVPVPTEEKSSQTSITILEEFLHEQHLLTEISWLNKMFLHKVSEAGKLQIAHCELFSPPPEHIS